MKVHHIESGDTPITLAKTYGVGIASLIKANDLSMRVGGDILALEFSYIGQEIHELKPGTLLRLSFWSTKQGHAVYTTDDGRFFTFPGGIPETYPLEVGSPYQDGVKIFLADSEWYSVSPWLEGQAVIIPN